MSRGDRPPDRRGAAGRAVDVGGIGGTLAGNALSLAAMRATLEHVLTDEAFARMIPLAERSPRACRRHRPPASLARHPARMPGRVRLPARARDGRRGGRVDGSRAGPVHAPVRAQPRHPLTPFHNMALMSPATTAADVDRHTEVFAEAVARADRAKPMHRSAVCTCTAGGAVGVASHRSVSEGQPRGDAREAFATDPAGWHG